MNTYWDEKALNDLLKDNPDVSVNEGDTRIPETQNKPLFSHPGASQKYHARKTEYNGYLYDSKKEAEFAEKLDLSGLHAGTVLYYLSQVPFRLPGRVVYRADFQVFYSDGSVHYYDVKGFDTPMSLLKRKQVEALYPVKIEIVK